MSRVLLAAALAVLVGVPVRAQSDLSGSSVALGASGTYVGAVSHSGYASLGDLRGRGVSLDATYNRLSVGAGVTFLRDETSVDLAAGVHVARNPNAQLATTLGLAVSLLEDGVRVATPSLSHSRRVYRRPGFAVVPGVAVGFAVVSSGRGRRDLQPVASAQLGLVLGRGPTRAVVAPSVGWTEGTSRTVTVGVSAGVTRAVGRR